MSEMQVNIVTPAGIVYNHRAKSVIAKAVDGEIGILANHIPIIVPLTIHAVRVQRVSVDTEDWIAVNGGVMEVRDNVCSIIADSAERARDIDVERAFEAKQRAEEELHKTEAIENNSHSKRAEISLRKAVNRITVSKHNKR
ncbi:MULTISPECIES: F0F1 ATP synthase subunit epsilon [Carnobacterium]|uniref:ATP synthase epsilon chain n=2 Tax=Carnobacterium inhibens TaxID=147709 RepID=U5SDD6_9LACT|nr:MULTISPECIES: F0F1 ATP synthase subunit epsilon [Carnobacterium]AGY82088.1 F0F1 ATP synthase subunit epsilon [Carnobacterium inhibens subsp. gilichinskyi]MBC9824224.1 F0F1 ATP synthase subunit epsilon [Carnobacterium inhibens]MCM3511546.1 F0F1 ATP synthase subunit epsilon [Carnobacterium inhibens]MDN5371350.1 F-type H+-transporting ATPase subunit epsilon [Carnobacterium sp.]